ncbi:MAG: hypothetical protein JSR80_05425 [Verrucomicrobia bacterium]|nr:hypothetical protein [Verrucomicrobiota bacterium]
MAPRSDRLKKLESELKDLEQWLKLGLVPKKDLPRHQEEIESLKLRIQEEQEKLRFLKESGEAEEYVTPRKQLARAQYTEAPTLPDMDIGEDNITLTEMGGNTATETSGDTIYEMATEEEEEPTEEAEEEEEEDPFSDSNRWKRGMLHADDDEW